METENISGLLRQTAEQLCETLLKSVICAECGGTYSTRKALRVHQRIHTGSRPYKCNRCPKSFTQANVLKAHSNSHDGERAYRCTVCSKSFIQSSHLRTHERTHLVNKLRFKCEKCDKYFTTKGAKDRHEYGHTGVTRFQCQRCKKYFTRSASLHSHLKTHEELREYHKCPLPQCTSTYTRKASLQRHIRNFHHWNPVTIQTPNVCDSASQTAGVETRVEVVTSDRTCPPGSMVSNFITSDDQFARYGIREASLTSSVSFTSLTGLGAQFESTSTQFPDPWLGGVELNSDTRSFLLGPLFSDDIIDPLDFNNLSSSTGLEPSTQKITTETTSANVLTSSKL